MLTQPCEHVIEKLPDAPFCVVVWSQDDAPIWQHVVDHDLPFHDQELHEVIRGGPAGAVESFLHEMVSVVARASTARISATFVATNEVLR